MITTVGKSGIALLLGPSGAYPNYLAIGSGSGVAVASNTNLVAEVRGVTPTTTDISVQKETTWTADFSATTMSGTIMREFGMKISGLSNVTWNREAFSPITFNGTNELQVQVTYQIF